MGPRPVGVAAEEGGVGFTGDVIDGEGFAVEVEGEGMVFVEFGDGADAVGGEEFAFVEEVF